MMQEVLLAVTGPITALVFVGLQRLFKAGAQDAAKVELQELLRGQFAEFRIKLLEDIDRKYRTEPECVLIEVAVQQRIGAIETKLQDVYAYAHDQVHEIQRE